MRDYVFNEARIRSSTFAFPWLNRVVKNWIARRYLRKLEQFDDYMLNDIGLTRDDLYYGQSLPFDVDPIGELERTRNQRARGIRRK
ncbi:DUF1127 domain-containing protein [Aestuariivirga sp.]|uniref:DUF1127 domain-containing protein n=1 Tax=Aestuariivirga sp. TaxID=2650926 RepID=UPI0039E282E3